MKEEIKKVNSDQNFPLGFRNRLNIFIKPIEIQIGIILLFVFPKQMGILLVVVVVGIVTTYLYLEAENKKQKKQRDDVTVTIRYDTKSCSKEFPLLVTIKNGSKKTVNKVSWNIGAYKKGYSNNVVEYGYSGEYRTPYSSDKILSSGQGHAVCYKVPPLSRTLEPQNLNWSAVSKSINFEQD